MASELARLKILLVEDHQAQAAALMAMLQAFGIGQVDVATDVTAATDKLNGPTAYDLMLCDYALGSSDGLSLVRKLRAGDAKSRRTMPVIMLTGDARPDRNILARTAGVDDFLSKPAHPEILLRMIHSALARAADRPAGQT